MLLRRDVLFVGNWLPIFLVGLLTPSSSVFHFFLDYLEYFLNTLLRNVGNSIAINTASSLPPPPQRTAVFCCW